MAYINKPRISSTRVNHRTEERYEIALPGIASQTEVDYAIAELRLFEVEMNGDEEGLESDITAYRDSTGRVTVWFGSGTSVSGFDWHNGIWPNTVTAESVLADRGIVKPTL